jgi:hypothetical protein
MPTGATAKMIYSSHEVLSLRYFVANSSPNKATRGARSVARLLVKSLSSVAPALPTAKARVRNVSRRPWSRQRRPAALQSEGRRALRKQSRCGRQIMSRPVLAVLQPPARRLALSASGLWFCQADKRTAGTSRTESIWGEGEYHGRLYDMGISEKQMGLEAVKTGRKEGTFHDWR